MPRRIGPAAGARAAPHRSLARGPGDGGPAGLPDRYQILVALAAGCGLRQGEAFGLSVDDIDFLRGVIHVRRQVKLIHSRQVFAPPKGGKERDVPLRKWSRWR
jgi:integrase